MQMAARFRLAKLIEDSGITQRDLAQRAEVSPTTVNRMVHNLTAQVSLNTLDALSRELGCEPGDIIERVPDNTKKRAKKR
jgi:putative transcriptional regulator